MFTWHVGGPGFTPGQGRKREGGQTLPKSTLNLIASRAKKERRQGMCQAYSKAEMRLKQTQKEIKQKDAGDMAQVKV